MNRHKKEAHIVDLSIPSSENAAHLLEALTTKLRMASAQALKASDIDLAQYEDFYELVTWVLEKKELSLSEIDAVVRTLGQLRKPNAPA